jgi:uncharacterized membrane protein
MKTLLLLLCAFGLIGFVCEWVFRGVTNKSLSIKEKLQELKLLLMVPCYSIACVMIGLIYKIPFMQNIKFLPLLMLMGGIIATASEFGYGILVNKVLKLNIWDYSHMKIKLFGRVIPLHIMGQIEIFHIILWLLLTPFVCYFSEIISWMAK